MRLFIALDLPAEIKKYLQSLQLLLTKVPMSNVHDFHVTLQFLGECSATQAEKIEKELEGVSFKPFTAQLHTMGTFGGRSPRVVWVGLKAPPELFKITKEIQQRMAHLGFLSENNFFPHVTLARIKEIKNNDAFLDAVQKIPVTPRTFTIENFFLFESRLSSQGATHIKRATFPHVF